jgi:hypothetical protein
MQLRPDEDCCARIFLAMAHWQKGEKERARRLYDQAVGWIDKTKPLDEELARFRAEATALLGVDPPGRESKPNPTPGPEGPPK